MKCTLCSFRFDETQALKSCSECLKIGACQRICCPNCHYEMPVEPKWAKKLVKYWQTWVKQLRGQNLF